MKPLITTLKNNGVQLDVSAESLIKDTWPVEILWNSLWDNEAIDALVEIGNEKAIKSLVGMFWEECRRSSGEEDGRYHYDLRESIAEALKKFGTQTIPKLRAKLKKIGEGCDVDSADWSAGAFAMPAAEVLKKIGNSEAIEALVAALNVENFNVREIIENTLREIGTPAVEFLILAVNSEYLRICKSAIDVLGEIKDATAVESLIVALNSRSESIRYKSARALGKIKDYRAVEPLILALKDEVSDVRRNAAGALGEIKDTRAIESLIIALNDENGLVRKDALTALSQFEDERAITAIKKYEEN